MAAVFMAVVEVDSTEAVAAFMAAEASAAGAVLEEVVLTVEAAVDSVEADLTAPARFAAAVGFAAAGDTVAPIVAAASGAGDPTGGAPTEVGRPWVAEALDLADLAGSDAASIMLRVADTETATDTGLAMRSRTAAGIHSEALEAPRMQEVPRDFAIPQLPMADGTRLEARARV